MVKTTKLAKPATTSRRTPDPNDDRREGYKLAITMLRELELNPDLCDDCALDELKQGQTKPQYISSIVTSSSAEDAPWTSQRDSARSFRISSLIVPKG